MVTMEKFIAIFVLFRVREAMYEGPYSAVLTKKESESDDKSMTAKISKFDDPIFGHFGLSDFHSI